MNIFMNTLNLAQKGHFEVTFARRECQNGKSCMQNAFVAGRHRTYFTKLKTMFMLSCSVKKTSFGDYLYSKSFTGSPEKPGRAKQLVPVLLTHTTLSNTLSTGGAPALVRAAHLGPNHGQRVAAPRSAALGTAADTAAGTVAQLLVVKPMAWRSLGSTRHAIPSRKRSHAAAPPR